MNRWCYRVETTNKKKVRRNHLITVKDAESDEDARRKIIHKLFGEGGQVHLIESNPDQTKHPGDGKRMSL